MWKKLSILTVLGLLIAPPIVIGAAAQDVDRPQATVLLRSGERVFGEFEDIEGNIVYMWLDEGQERRLRLRDVVLIDFGGDARDLPADEVAAVRGRSHLLVLHRDRQVTGQLVDVERFGEGVRTIDSPIWFNFRTADGRVTRYRAGDISRVYLAPPPRNLVARAQPPLGAPLYGQITVTGRTEWTPTNFYVREGDMVAFDAQGQIRLSQNGDDVATPAGSTVGRLAQNAPLPRELAGALIGRVGNSTPFGIGDQRHPLRMPASGQLYLSINDDFLGDNTGAYDVTMTGRGGTITTERRSDTGRHHFGVRAADRWTPTNLYVREGDMVVFHASGEVRLSPTPNDLAAPAGSLIHRLAPRAPLAGDLAGSLIGRIGSSVFGIGDQTHPLRMPATGELFLGVNDDMFADNEGTFQVTVISRPPFTE